MTATNPTTGPAPTPVEPRRPRRAWGLAVAAAVFALMMATEPRLAIVWDEGYTLGREARIRRWFRALRDPEAFARSWRPPPMELVQADRFPPPSPDRVNTRAKLFAPDVVAYFWPFAREEPHGHPPFYAIVGLVGDLVAPGLSDLPRARLGPILAFSLTAGVLFSSLARRRGLWAGVAAATAWTLQPRLFAHGHYAAYDALLTCLWVNAIVAFWIAVEPGTRRPKLWAGWLGVLFGWAAVTKLTGWFLPLPFLAWAVVARSKSAMRAAMIAAPVALVTLYLFNPGWWADPIGGVERFLRSNLTRGRTIPIPVSFLGTVYNTPIESLPPYNTIAWTLMVTPVGFLGLAMVGVFHAIRRWRIDGLGVLAVGHWAFLLALRALPHTPGHDGIRLFLPAFGVLAILAGLGASAIAGRSIRWGRGIVIASAIEGALSVGLMMPVPLSYYSPIVGGLPGAARLGMEPTYYWDALGDDALAFLNAKTPPGSTVAFGGVPTSFLELRRIGRLVPDFLPSRAATPAWFVLQNRPGSMRAYQPWYDRRGEAAFVVEKLGVPLVWIIPFSPGGPR